MRGRVYMFLPSTPVIYLSILDLLQIIAPMPKPSRFIYSLDFILPRSDYDQIALLKLPATR